MVEYCHGHVVLMVKFARVLGEPSQALSDVVATGEHRLISRG